MRSSSLQSGYCRHFYWRSRRRRISPNLGLCPVRVTLFPAIQNIAFDGQRPVAIKPIIIWYFMKNSGRSPGIIEDEVFNVATNLPARLDTWALLISRPLPPVPDNEERGAFAPKMPNGLSAALDVPTLRGIETGTLRFYFSDISNTPIAFGSSGTVRLGSVSCTSPVAYRASIRSVTPKLGLHLRVLTRLNRGKAPNPVTGWLWTQSCPNPSPPGFADKQGNYRENWEIRPCFGRSGSNWPLILQVWLSLGVAGIREACLGFQGSLF